MKDKESQAEQADLDELYGGDAAEVAGDAAAAADSDDNAEVSSIAKIVTICYFPADNHKLISYQPPVHASPQHNDIDQNHLSYCIAELMLQGKVSEHTPLCLVQMLT